MNNLHVYFIIFSSIFVLTYSTKQYGSFNITLTDIELCRGPKHKECSVIKAQITSRNVIQYDVNVTKSFSPTKGKMVAIADGKEYLRFHMKKPCDHLYVKPLLHSFFNITKDCVILKGQYQNSADVQKLTRSFFGGSFLLGNWTFKSLIYGDECNFYCANVKVRMF